LEKGPRTDSDVKITVGATIKRMVTESRVVFPGGVLTERVEADGRVVACVFCGVGTERAPADGRVFVCGGIAKER
jgi:hypothetical protein